MTEPLPLTFLDPLIGCVSDDEMRIPVTVAWTVEDGTTPITGITVFYTDPTTGGNITACAGLSGQQETCSFSLQLSEDVSVISVFVNAPGFATSTNTFQSE